MAEHETLVGTPDPDDHRTPEQRYADHEIGIRREIAAEQRIADEWHAAIDSGASAAELARFTHEQADRGTSSGEVE